MWDIRHQSIQWPSGPYQDVVHYSRMGYPSFLKSLSFCDFSSNLTVPDIQNSSLFGISRNGISLDQERFKSTLPMLLPVDHHMTNLGSSMNGFQWVCLIFRQTWQVWTYMFLNFNRTCEISRTNQLNERQDLIKVLFTTLGWHIQVFWNVCRFAILQIWQVRTCKIFTFWEITELEIYRSRTLQINPSNVIACWSSCDHFGSSMNGFQQV